MPKKRVLYACGVDWQHEIGEAGDLEGKQPLYSSVDELKAKSPCWESCGIVKIKLIEGAWVEEQDLLKGSVPASELK